MFQKSFNCAVQKVTPRRVSDEDGGSVHLTMKVKMEMTEELLDEIGEEYTAMYLSRKAGKGTVSVPFKSATLDLVHKDLSMTVYGPSKDQDGKWDPRFQTPECEAKAFKLVRQSEDTTKVDLEFNISVPPLKLQSRNHLIDSVGEDLRIALTPTQGELPYDG